MIEEKISGRVIPQNVEAERAVIGAILLDPSVIYNAIDSLAPEDFYLPAHKIIFEVLISLFEKNEAIDLVTINNALLKRNALESVGSTTYISELLETVPTSANISYHTKIVREKAILRSLIRNSTEIISRCYDDTDEADELLDIAESKIFEISGKRETNSVVHIKDQIKKTFEVIDQLYQQQGVLTGLPSGYKDLDSITSGFQNSEMIILAARPSMGKTAFACGVIEHVALVEKRPVLFFSLEMSKENLVQRMLCSYAKVSGSELRKGFVSEDGWRRLTESAGVLSSADIYIDDTPGISVLEIRNKARRLKAQGKVDLIVIDYLQLMRSYKKTENRQQEISEISRSIKGIARELNVPVVALSQLSRAVESRQDHKPQLSDLRESGAIEQDADLVLMLVREEYYNATEENRNKAEVVVGKNRNGPTGAVKLAFLKEFTRFENISFREE